MKRLILVLGLLWPAAGVADFDAGADAYERRDYEQSLQEWLPLAEQGNAAAQNKLGNLYSDGRGVPQDYVQAHKWYNLAGAPPPLRADASAGEKARRNRDRVTQKMTPAQVAEAQKLAREWKPK